jgi:hypothetical protein
MHAHLSERNLKGIRNLQRAARLRRKKRERGKQIYTHDVPLNNKTHAIDIDIDHEIDHDQVAIGD